MPDVDGVALELRGVRVAVTAFFIIRLAALSARFVVFPHGCLPFRGF